MKRERGRKGEREEAPPPLLRYVGPEPDGVVLLPEGWPAADHEEADAVVRSEKLASGCYETGAMSTEEAHDGERD